MATRTIANGGGNWGSTSTWVEGAVPTSSDNVVATSTSGALTIAATGATCSTIDFTNYTSTFTYSGQTLTVVGNKCLFVSGMTVTGNGTSALVCSGAGVTLTTAGKTLPGTTSLTGSGTAAVKGAATFTNLTRTGTAAVGDGVTFDSNITVSTTLHLDGNASVFRLFVGSSSGGSQRTITCNGTVSASNLNLQDIKGAGSASWNLSAVTGLSGDCGNNATVTLTTAGTQYYIGNTGNWSTGASWASSSGGTASSGRVPLPQDTAILDSHSFSAGSQTLTLNLPYISKIDASAVTNSPTIALSVTVVPCGNWTLHSGLTLSLGANNLTYQASQSLSFTQAGATITGTGTIQTFTSVSYTLTLADAFTTPAGLSNLTGNLTAANNVTCATFTSDSIAGTTTFGSGTWSLTGTSGTVFNVTGGTISAASATIVISTASSSSRTFAGNGGSYGTLQYVVAASSGALVITGTNTFVDLDVENDTTAKTLTLPHGVVTKVTSTCTLTGNASATLVVQSDTSAAATLQTAFMNEGHNSYTSGTGPVIVTHVAVQQTAQATRVLGSAAYRTVTDLVTNGTTTIQSATANFSSSTDVGAGLAGTTDIPAGAYIQSVTDSTHAVMNTPATGSHSGQTCHIGSDQNDSVWIKIDSTSGITVGGTVTIAGCTGGSWSQLNGTNNVLAVLDGKYLIVDIPGNIPQGSYTANSGTVNGTHTIASAYPWGGVISKKFATDVQSNSILVAFIQRGAFTLDGPLPSVESVWDDQGNPWKQVVEASPNFGWRGIDVWVCERATPTGTAPTVTAIQAAFTRYATNLNMLLVEYSTNNVCHEVIDTYGITESSTTSLALSTLDSTVSHDFLVATICGGFSAVTLPTGFTSRVTDTADGWVVCDNIDSGAAGVISATFSGLTGNTNAIGALIAFRAQGMVNSSGCYRRSSTYWAPPVILAGTNTLVLPTYPFTPVAGDTMLVGFVPEGFGSSVTNVTDDQGNKWYKVADMGDDTLGGIWVSIWCAQNVAGTAPTLTVTFSSSASGFGSAFTADYANFPTVTAVDRGIKNLMYGITASPSCSGMAQPGDYVAFFINNDFGPFNNFQAGAGWRPILMDSNGGAGWFEKRGLSAGGTETITFTYDNANVEGSIVGMALGPMGQIQAAQSVQNKCQAVHRASRW